MYKYLLRIHIRLMLKHIKDIWIFMVVFKKKVNEASIIIRIKLIEIYVLGEGYTFSAKGLNLYLNPKEYPTFITSYIHIFMYTLEMIFTYF